MELGVGCRKDSAKITFNLDNLNSLGWLDGLDVMLTFSNRTLDEQRIPLTNLEIKEFTLSELKPGSKYNFCLKFMVKSEGEVMDMAHFCEVNLTSQGQLNLNFHHFRDVHQVNFTMTICVDEWILVRRSHLLFPNSPARQNSRFR